MVALNRVIILISHFYLFVIRFKNGVFIFYIEVNETLKNVFYDENFAFLS